MCAFGRNRISRPLAIATPGVANACVLDDVRYFKRLFSPYRFPDLDFDAAPRRAPDSMCDFGLNSGARNFAIGTPGIAASQVPSAARFSLKSGGAYRYTD